MDIAIIGLACRFPQANDVATFWENLLAGRHCVTEIPADRWDWRRFADPSKPERYSYANTGGFIDGVDLFDPVFFGILPSEAAGIDPHERLFLECTWCLLEQAGYLGASTVVNDTGVFVGLTQSVYGQIGASRWSSGRFTGVQSAPWSVANRVSYHFDFHGPSFTVDSACSSSLLSVYLAIESLRRGECAMAIAGGVNLILHPAQYVQLSAAGLLARDGRCKTFDEGADGFVPGEGVAAVLLKPLEDAIADDDQTWAVIKGGAIRSKGRTLGYGVPSPASQAKLIAGALTRAGVEPDSVSYVEANGTGTPLGDLIEIKGLIDGYGPASPDHARFVGCVKPNIGHLDGAAGIAALMKTVLQLKRGTLAPCINITKLSPTIDFAASPFQPVPSVMDWPEGNGPRRAAVSAFGIGGTDVHVLAEEYRAPERVSEPPTVRSAAFLLSARNGDQLRDLASQVLESLRTGPMRDAPIASVIRSSQVGRREMRERLGVIAPSADALVAGLRDFLSGTPSAQVRVGRAPALVLSDPPLTGADDKEAITRWCAGQAVDWDARWAEVRPARVPFPRYPFARKRYWPRDDDGRRC